MNYNKAANRMRKGAAGLRKAVDKMSNQAVRKEALKLSGMMDKSADAMDKLAKEAKAQKKEEKRLAKAFNKKGKDKKKKRR